MAAENKLDMSLEDLIKTAKKKQPAKKKPAAAGAAGSKAKQGAQKQQQPAKPGAQKQQPAKQGAKGKLAAAHQQPGKKGVPLKAKGGVAKPQGGAKQAPAKGAKGGRPDVRVVPRPGGTQGGRPQQQQGPPVVMMVPPPAYGYGMPMQPVPPPGAKWGNDMFDGALVSNSTSAKLLISNLDFKVTDDDIKELFGTVGPIKESTVNYDKNGRSQGTATVVFERRADALAAFNRYNNVALDNKKMMIEVVEVAVPRGTFKTLTSGINVSRPTMAGAGPGTRRRGGAGPQGDAMQE